MDKGLASNFEIQGKLRISQATILLSSERDFIKK